MRPIQTLRKLKLFDMFIFCTQFSILCSKSMKWKHIRVWLLYLKSMCTKLWLCLLDKLDVSPSQYYKHAFIFDVRVSRLEKPRDVFDVPSFYLTQAPFSSFFLCLSFWHTFFICMQMTWYNPIRAFTKLRRIYLTSKFESGKKTFKTAVVKYSNFYLL